MKKKFYLTTPIYYASGQPHVGHAFSTLTADVLARYHRSQGEDVWFVAGMDEHGAKIAAQAEKEQKEPQAYVDEISAAYKSLWQKLDLQYDDFIRTTDERHIKGVNEFIRRLQEAGDIYEGDYSGLYCIGCEKFLTAKELVDGKCPDHHTRPEKVVEKNYFFKLKKYLPQIKAKIESGELMITPVSRKNEILRMIADDIPDFSVSREKVAWGIPFPGDEKQTVYVWVDALMNYVTVLDFPDGEKYKKYWPADLHIIGVEINKFHSIFWPALLLSIGAPLPRQIFVHGLFTVNGQKMSKTLGNVIDPLKMVEQFGVEATRYLLLSQFSALEHGDIREAEFAGKYNDDLAKGVGNIFERILTMVVNYDGSVTPATELDPAWQSTVEAYHQKMAAFDLFGALSETFALIKQIDRYIDEEKPWALVKTDPKKLPTILASLLAGMEAVADLLAPFLPETIAKARAYAARVQKGEIKGTTEREKLNLFPRIIKPEARKT